MAMLVYQRVKCHTLQKSLCQKSERTPLPWLLQVTVTEVLHVHHLTETDLHDLTRVKLFITC